MQVRDGFRFEIDFFWNIKIRLRMLQNFLFDRYREEYTTTNINTSVAVKSSY